MTELFFNNQTHDKQDDYKRFLQTVGSLSNLSSESTMPYLSSRMAEKIFCKAFNVEDLSRSDVSADAKSQNIGIGLKTFLQGNHKTLQKITEFGSKNKSLYEELSLEERVIKIATLRNERLNFTNRVHDLKRSIYHCVVRGVEKFMIFEETMDFIDIGKISNIKDRNGSLVFDDGLHEYSFLKSKNTLQKRFLTNNIIYEFPVEIIENPLNMLLDCIGNVSKKQMANKPTKDTVFLPLYGRGRLVYPSSGLNQWNAKGRARNINEVYIPIPSVVHNLKPNFFPNREEPFSLKLPNGKIIQSKVCQDNDKALMSYSNRELGEWILRDVLKLKEGELVTYEMLQDLGVDSVRIDKIDNTKYEINFATIGSYDKFIEQEN